MNDYVKKLIEANNTVKLEVFTYILNNISSLNILIRIKVGIGLILGRNFKVVSKEK